MANQQSVEHAPREFDFSKGDFEHVRKLIYERAGISLSESKQNMVYSRLIRRVRARGLSSFADYLGLLEHGDDAVEWQEFTNSLTTNLTSFFREEHHFPVLAEHVRKMKSGQQIQLWCCASSTGEEPYSMAMTMVEAFGSYSPPVRILATDLDTNVLATAQRGVYPLERLEKMQPERLKKFFLKGKGSHAGSASVRQELRDMITFRQLNLLDDSWSVHGPFDAIFCRNVMIYFDEAEQKRLVEKFHRCLNRSGYLFVGHAESLFGLTTKFRMIHQNNGTAYERIEESQ